MNTQDKPLAGMVVLPFGAPDFWAASETLFRFKQLGGRVAKASDPRMTHLVTLLDPLPIGAPNNGTLFGSEYRDYMALRRELVERRSIADVISMEIFKDLVMAAKNRVDERAKSLRQQVHDQTLFSLHAARPKAFVGL